MFRLLGSDQAYHGECDARPREGEALKYGREDDDWDVLTAAGIDFLKERARLGRDTSYTELNTVLAQRTSLRSFDFHEQSDRAAMGHLLGLIVDETLPSVRFMLSSLVVYLDENDAGPGFYALAQEKGLLSRNATKDERFAFWVSQIKEAHDSYRRG